MMSAMYSSSIISSDETCVFQGTSFTGSAGSSLSASKISIPVVANVRSLSNTIKSSFSRASDTADVGVLDAVTAKFDSEFSGSRVRN
jgi:hypothetical protein